MDKISAEQSQSNKYPKGSRRPQTFKLSPGLIKRLGHYVVDRSSKDGHRIEKSEVAEQAIDEFLSKEGH